MSNQPMALVHPETARQLAKDPRFKPSATVHMRPRANLLDYPRKWFDNHDVPAKDGHRHEYSFRTLICAHGTCMVRPKVYQFVNLPGRELPPRPGGCAILPVYRQDIENRFMAVQNAHMASQLFHLAWRQPEIDTGGIWLGQWA